MVERYSSQEKELMIGLLKSGVDEKIFQFHHVGVFYGSFGVLGRFHSLRIFGANIELCVKNDSVGAFNVEVHR